MRKGFLSVCSLLHLHCLKESLAREVHRQYSWNEWQGDGSRAPSSVSDLDDGCPQLFPFLFLCSMFQCLSGFSRVPSWKYFHPRTTESVSIIYWGWCVQGPTDPDRARLEPRPPDSQPGFFLFPLWSRCIGCSPTLSFFVLHWSALSRWDIWAWVPNAHLKVICPGLCIYAWFSDLYPGSTWNLSPASL